MIKLNLRSHLKGATPDEVFDALSDREGLNILLPRMRKIEFYDERANSQKMVMHISIGAGFGTIRCEGTLSWVEPHELTFTVHTPLPVETKWKLAPAVNGTELDISMQLDLEPMLGPMARFVPSATVKEMMQKEMTHAIKQIALRVQDTRVKDQAVAA